MGFGQFIRRRRVWGAALVFVLLSSGRLLAAPEEASDTEAGHFGLVLFQVIAILIAAKIGGDLFVRIGQPAVLGELVFGILIGNLHLLGVDWFTAIRTDGSIRILAELGVVLLLFQVGLESDLGQMAKVGASAVLVATIGVAAPFALGWLVAAIFYPSQGFYAHAFVGAALCATSVGITARVLKDMGKLRTTEARIILGAAVIDDIEGLILLAVIQGVISATDAGGTMSPATVLVVVGKAFGFLVGAVFIGKFIVPKIYTAASKLRTSDLLLTTSIGICFALAYLASVLNLAPIVGAFAAGLLLDETDVKDFTENGENGKKSVEDLMSPIAAMLVPVFFVSMGASVDITTLFQPSLLGFAAVLTIAAIAGKQVCGFGVVQKRVDKIAVGIGMIPRGEVGLIFAAIGSTLMLGGRSVITPPLFSALVIMVIITTVVSPGLLKWRMSAKTDKKTVKAAEAQAP